MYVRKNDLIEAIQYQHNYLHLADV